MTSTNSNPTGRIEGLDGLRAMAVLAVLGYHLRPSAVPGGFLGVDVFFVISGFLITTLLIREQRTAGRIDLRAFWIRRGRRLLPALVTVVATSIIVARLVDSDLLVNIKRQTIGAATFSTNWIEIGASTDYFDASSPLLFNTFWSLAIEEQFYLLWPIVIVGLVRARVRLTHAAMFTLVAAGGSATLMSVLIASGVSATRVYYGTDTHLFGLMLGASLAFAFAAPVPILASRRWHRLRLWVGFVGMAAVVALIFGIDHASPITYHGGIALASACSVLMVVALPGGPTLFTGLLQTRPLSWVGQRSYGIYLWHWPVFLVVSELLPAPAPGVPPTLLTALSVLAVTAILSEASYQWIEGPIRHNGFVGTWHALVGRRLMRMAAPAVIVLMALVGLSLATAPDRSRAQLSVEAGQRAIESQPALVPTTVPATTTMPATTTVPATTTPDTTTPDTITIPPDPAWPRDLAVPPGELMMGFGDSVLSGAAPAIYERFPGIYIDATPILQWRDAPAIVDELRQAGTTRPVVILHFGTNAGLKDEWSVEALREVLDILGPDRRVVLLTVVGISYWIPATNDMLREVSAEYPNTIVADWHAVIEESPELLHNDQTHPNSAGIIIYAELVASALEELGPG
ncbi:MAG: acyltransferase family protein [Acidimicrobiales bacterium]|nr:acyltransferase family protein [Acidimicrobiales bacterium]MDG2217692.1 acyltransferase family protein [Acidimicrobiales bacterium]